MRQRVWRRLVVEKEERGGMDGVVEWLTRAARVESFEGDGFTAMDMVGDGGAGDNGYIVGFTHPHQQHSSPPL
ncbi:hypothetical protein Droror1_Dr00002640 [Drosera rotundifolia]